MTDEPKPMPTMGDCLKGIQERLSQFPSRGEYGDNGVIGWFLGLESDNKELRAKVSEMEELVKSVGEEVRESAIAVAWCLQDLEGAGLKNDGTGKRLSQVAAERIAELEAREQRIREAAFHPLFNSLESVATIKTILTLG